MTHYPWVNCGSSLLIVVKQCKNMVKRVISLSTKSLLYIYYQPLSVSFGSMDQVIRICQWATSHHPTCVQNVYTSKIAICTAKTMLNKWVWGCPVSKRTHSVVSCCFCWSSFTRNLRESLTTAWFG